VSFLRILVSSLCPTVIVIGPKVRILCNVQIASPNNVGMTKVMSLRQISHQFLCLPGDSGNVSKFFDLALRGKVSF
jgi:hypothetical protein